MKRTLMFLQLLVIGLILCTSGCEDSNRDNYHHDDYADDYGRYVSVRIDNFTSYEVDILLGNAVIESLESGETYNYSARLFDEEKLIIRYLVKRYDYYSNQASWYTLPDSDHWQQREFDNRVREWHVKVYNDWVYRNDTGSQSTSRR